MDDSARRVRVTRRSLLGGGLLVGTGTVAAAGVAAGTSDALGASNRPAEKSAASFYGPHQLDVGTDTQGHTVLASFDLSDDAARDDVAAMLEAWSALAQEMTTGTTRRIPTLGDSPLSRGSASDSLEAYQLGPQRLTVTIGFGRSLFRTDAGDDRLGLAHALPDALVDLPSFEGDDLVTAESNGDILVHACSDDPQVAFHAIRSIDRVAPDVTTLRWVQPGFSPPSTETTPRNLLGFRDGSLNSTLHPPEDLETVLWAGPEGPSWMRGGTYLVYRRIRLKLDSWDLLPSKEQEQVIGRRKLDGAPLGQPGEFSPLALGRLDRQGNWWIPPVSHVRIASPEVNDGAVIVRRSFSYVNGTAIPGSDAGPDALEYDAGSLFLGYQKDPRNGFVPVYGKLALVDSLRRFTTHTASAVFAIPPGASGPGDWVGRSLFT